MSRVEIRRVNGDTDLAAAHAVRRAVFVEGQDVPEAIEYDGSDAIARHLVALDGEQPVGTARLRSPEEGVAKIERVAVLESHRGRGIGRRLVARLEGLAREEGLTVAILHAQTRVESFYAEIGYERTSDVFEEAGIPHVEMRKQIGSENS